MTSDSKKSKWTDEFMKEYRKKYYLKNKDKILASMTQKIECDVCGSKIMKSIKNIHNNTEKHKLYSQLEKLNDDNLKSYLKLYGSKQDIKKALEMQNL